MPATVVHFQIRMPPALHEMLASWARQDNDSLNTLVVGILEVAMERRNASPPRPVMARPLT
jgi:predicted HicB family RNase H-like nuclease